MDITRLKRSCEHDATYSNGGYNVPELRKFATEITGVPKSAKRSDLLAILCKHYHDSFQYSVVTEVLKPLKLKKLAPPNIISPASTEESRTKLPLNRDIAQKCRSCLEAIKHYKTRLIGAKISKKFTEVDVWHDLLVKCDTCHDALFKQLQKDADLGYMDRPMSDDRGHRTQNTLLQY